MVPALFCKTTSAIDPYVYAISHPKFREELWKLLGVTKKKKKTNNNCKVWSTEPKFSSSLDLRSKDYFDDDDVEEETVEIELKTVDLGEYSCRHDFKKEDFKSERRELKKQASMASLLCLKPTFVNKTSSFRRLTRQFSTTSRSQSREEKESSNY